MSTVEEINRAAGALSTAEREELLAWYERRGYHRTGIKKPFPAVDPRFGIPRRDDLRFEVLEKAL